MGAVGSPGTWEWGVESRGNCVILEALSDYFPKQLYPLLCSLAVCESSDFSASSLVLVLIMAILMGVMWYQSGFEPHFPHDEWCGALLVCLLAICTSALGVWPLTSFAQCLLELIRCRPHHLEVGKEKNLGTQTG